MANQEPKEEDFSDLTEEELDVKKEAALKYDGYEEVKPNEDLDWENPAVVNKQEPAKDKDIMPPPMEDLNVNNCPVTLLFRWGGGSSQAVYQDAETLLDLDLRRANQGFVAHAYCAAGQYHLLIHAKAKNVVLDMLKIHFALLIGPFAQCVISSPDRQQHTGLATETISLN